MKKRVLITIVLLLCVIGLAKVCAPKENTQTSNTNEPRKTRKVSVAERARPYKDPSDLAKEGTWRKKSESKAYPKIKNKKGLEIRVSLKGNRVYILQKGKVVYTMLATAGKYKNGKSATPTGTFEIEGDRGDQFFNYDLNEGANNWTSWDKDNVYLFHSVPTKDDGQYNLKEAKKLGKTQGSHGCIRLSIPDSKWLMTKIPDGTKVVIKDE